MLRADKRIKILRFSDELIKVFGKLSKEVLADIAAKDPLTRKVYDSYMAFLAGIMDWGELSETGYRDDPPAGAGVGGDDDEDPTPRTSCSGATAAVARRRACRRRRSRRGIKELKMVTSWPARIRRDARPAPSDWRNRLPQCRTVASRSRSIRPTVWSVAFEVFDAVSCRRRRHVSFGRLLLRRPSRRR